MRWRLRIPRHALAGRVFDIALEVDGHVEWADDNRLGLHLRALAVRTGLIPLALRDWLDERIVAVACLLRPWRRAASPWRRRLAAMRLSWGGASRQ